MLQSHTDVILCIIYTAVVRGPQCPRTLALNLMTFITVTSLSGIICFKATRHPANTPWKPLTS